MAVPKTDAPLAQYSTNFNTRGLADAGAFGLSSQQMEQYDVLHQAWMAAYNACKSEGGKSPALCRAKDSAKAALLPYARQLYAFVQSSLLVSDANKLLMGVKVRNTDMTRVQPPMLAPLLMLISVVGRTATYRLCDATAPSSRRRPFNAEGATIMSFVGNNPPPAGGPGWKLERQCGRTTFEITFPDNVAPGIPCWATALWYCPRGDYSPAATPVQTYLQVGPVVEVA